MAKETMDAASHPTEAEPLDVSAAWPLPLQTSSDPHMGHIREESRDRGAATAPGSANQPGSLTLPAMDPSTLLDSPSFDAREPAELKGVGKVPGWAGKAKEPRQLEPFSVDSSFPRIEETSDNARAKAFRDFGKSAMKPRGDRHPTSSAAPRLETAETTEVNDASTTRDPPGASVAGQSIENVDDKFDNTGPVHPPSRQVSWHIDDFKDGRPIMEVRLPTERGSLHTLTPRSSALAFAREDVSFGGAVSALIYIGHVISRAKAEYGDDYARCFLPAAYILRPWPRGCLALDQERNAFTRAKEAFDDDIAALLFPELADSVGKDPHPWACTEMETHHYNSKLLHNIWSNCGKGIAKLLFPEMTYPNFNPEKAAINVYQRSSPFYKTWSYSVADFMNLEVNSIIHEKSIFIPCDLDWLSMGALGAKLSIDPIIFVHYCSKLLSSVSQNSHRLWRAGKTAHLVAKKLKACTMFVWDGHCPKPTNDDGYGDTFRSVTSYYRVYKSRHVLLSKGRYEYTRDIDETQFQIKAHKVKTFLQSRNDELEYGPLISPSLKELKSGLYWQIPSLFLETSSLSAGSAALGTTHLINNAAPIHSIIPHMNLMFSQPNEFFLIDKAAEGSLKVSFSTFGFVLSMYSWKENLERLNKEIAEIEQGDIITWTDDIFTRLHAARRKLAYLRYEVHELQEKYSEIICATKKDYNDPVEAYFSSLNRRADQIVERLNDLFQMIMGTISLKEARESIKLAERATFLTVVAVVYLPLSLTTGVFGMNIYEINKGTPTWRACAELAGGFIGATIACVVIAHYYRHQPRWVGAVVRAVLRWIKGFSEVYWDPCLIWWILHRPNFGRHAAFGDPPKSGQPAPKPAEKVSTSEGLQDRLSARHSPPPQISQDYIDV